MKRNKALNVGEVVSLFLRENGLETPLNEYRLIQAWPTLVGQGIAAYTSNLFIKNQILFMHVSSAAVRQELMMRRSMLVSKLNEIVKTQVVVNIIFR